MVIQTARQFFLSGKDAENSIDNYEHAKKSSFDDSTRKLFFNTMVKHVKIAKDKEKTYNEMILSANDFTKVFVTEISQAMELFEKIEKERSAAVSDALNKFLVYQTFQEQSNKYDVKNFTKAIEEVNPDKSY